MKARCKWAGACSAMVFRSANAEKWRRQRVAPETKVAKRQIIDAVVYSSLISDYSILI